MPGIKRSLADTNLQVPNESDSPRKRRGEYNEADAQLAKYYDHLADDILSVRLEATRALVRSLSTKAPDQEQRLSNALTRLIRGLCSGRKAARPGFSIALSEALRLAFNLAYSQKVKTLELGAIIERVAKLTHPEGNPSGQEKREYSIGQRFAFQAILQSDVAHVEGLQSNEWRQFLDSICDLANQKGWLRIECGAMLLQYLDSPDGRRLPTERIKVIVEALNDAKLLKTPEGVALWLSIAERNPDVPPQGVWHKKDPLSPDERLTLKKLMLGVSSGNGGTSANGLGSKPGGRQSHLGFAWKVLLSHLYRRKAKAFKSTWDEIVTKGLLADQASAERKALGFQVVCTAISSSPLDLLPTVLNESVVRYILSQRFDAERYLHEASKLVLDAIKVRASAEQQTASGLLDILLAEGAFDQRTKTKTCETILQQVTNGTLADLIPIVRARVAKPGVEDEQQVESRRRMLCDMLLNLLRAKRDSLQVLASDGTQSEGGALAVWLQLLLQTFIDFGYRRLSGVATVSEGTRSTCRVRLTSCLTHLMDSLPRDATDVTKFVAKELTTMDDLYKPISKSAREAILAARASRKALKMQQKQGKISEAAAKAYKMLYDLSTLQVFNEEPDSVEVLQDLDISLQDNEGNSSTVLVELVLSFVSKPSTLFRKLAQQVFSAFASELNAESLQSLTDILNQKESMSGQQELFQQGQADSADEDSEADDDNESEEKMDDEDGIGEAIDVDDMSDVELFNGKIAGDMDDDSQKSTSDSEGSSDAEDGAPEDEDDEVAAFNKKLAESLGPAAITLDSDDDGSDLDDDQMMEHDVALSNVFREQKKVASKKQDNKDAKENMVNFKNRVLDLLSIYVKSQYGNILAMELILPLTSLVRTTSSKPTAEKAFAVLKTYFDACTKHKALPQPEDPDAVFEALEHLHEEMQLGGSKMHANACSRSSLFLSKVLVSQDEQYFGRVGEMYLKLLSEWHMNPKSKIQRDIFNQWMSWSLSTQKQN